MTSNGHRELGGGKSRPWVRYVVAIAVFVVGCLAMFLYSKPRIQLIPRTGYYLSVAIESFVRDTGEMPSCFEDLTGRGLVTIDGGEAVLNIDEYPRALLRYLNAIEVNWGANLALVDVRQGDLIDLRSGTKTFIIRRPWWCGGDYEDGHLRILEAYRSHSLHQASPGGQS